MAEQAFTKQQAIDRAMETARRSYRDVERFEVTTEEDRQQWKISFRDRHALVDGGSAHFAVWVDKKTGEAQLFRGR